MANLPPGVAARAGGVAVATTTTTAVATAAAAHGGWGAAVAGRTAEATTAAVGALGSTTPAASAATETAAAAAAHATNIASGSAATAATASTTSTATTAAEARALTSDGLEELRNLLVGLLKQIEEVTHDAAVAAVEESSGNTSVSCTSGTTNTMDVVINVGRKVVVHHVSHVGYVFGLISTCGKCKVSVKTM